MGMISGWVQKVTEHRGTILLIVLYYEIKNKKKPHRIKLFKLFGIKWYECEACNAMISLPKRGMSLGHDIPCFAWTRFHPLSVLVWLDDFGKRRKREEKNSRRIRDLSQSFMHINRYAYTRAALIYSVFFFRFFSLLLFFLTFL